MCPVCYFPNMQYPAEDYNICPCCGTEFGNHDDDYSLSELRDMWIARGCPWFFENPPIGWNASLQLYGGYVAVVPFAEYSIPSGPPLVSYLYNEDPEEMLALAS